MSQRSSACSHAGTVWRVHVIGLHGMHEPGDWECTRCGAQWDQHPVLARIERANGR